MSRYAVGVLHGVTATIWCSLFAAGLWHHFVPADGWIFGLWLSGIVGAGVIGMSGLEP